MNLILRRYQVGEDLASVAQHRRRSIITRGFDTEDYHFSVVRVRLGSPPVHGTKRPPPCGSPNSSSTLGNSWLPPYRSCPRRENSLHVKHKLQQAKTARR